MFLALYYCRDRANRGINFVQGEGGVRFKILPRIPLFLGRFLQEMRDKGSVWGLADNFDKDLLVFGCGSLLGLCKYRCLLYPGRREGSG